ncbi:unnamed protein product [Mycena citricolor]|uniref:Uncharacterized protein n=1 Tax=Mycena citricolor TaxID=2018698 RepID=A0AAD2GVX4_9AGAR|nr:unnamed protein product [Mycena citricolor]
MALPVDPSGHLAALITWSTLNLFAGVFNTLLFITTLIAQGLDAQATLLNLQIVFILASISNSALVWTGHALRQHVPFSLCTFNAAVNMSNVPLMSGAALAMVAQVWGTAMKTWHPRLEPILAWVVWTPLLVALPYLCAVPLFVTAVILGVTRPADVFRGSPFYCVVNINWIQILTSCFGAIFSLVTLVLAVWTSSRIFVTRQRRQQSPSRVHDSGSPLLSHAFIIRVVAFSCFVLAASITGLLALATAFTAVVPDIVLASCGVGAFFIFASSKPILRFVFRCRRKQDAVCQTFSFSQSIIIPEMSDASSQVPERHSTDSDSGGPDYMYKARFGDIQIVRTVATTQEDILRLHGLRD